MYISMIMLVGASRPCNAPRYPQRPSPCAPMIFHYHRLYGKPLLTTTSICDRNLYINQSTVMLFITSTCQFNRWNVWFVDVSHTEAVVF